MFSVQPVNSIVNLKDFLATQNESFHALVRYDGKVEATYFIRCDLLKDKVFFLESPCELVWYDGSAVVENFKVSTYLNSKII